MRIPPRSRRGTWLLAGAVLSAACAGLWWALPAVPRGMLQLPDQGRLLAFGPDSKTALVARRLSQPDDPPKQRSDEPRVLAMELERLLNQVRGGQTDQVKEQKAAPVPEYALDLIDVPSGELLMSLMEQCIAPHVSGSSSDGRVHVCELDDGYLRLDLAARTVTRLTIVDKKFAKCRFLSMSLDGHWGLFEVYPIEQQARSNHVVMCDLLKNQLRGKVDGIQAPTTFSTDSRSFVAVSSEQGAWVCSFDADTLAIRTTFSGPNAAAVQELCTNRDGTYAAATFSQGNGTVELVCWDVHSGAIVIRGPFWRPRFDSSGHLMFKCDGRENVLDLESPIRSVDVATGDVGFTVASGELSPDGKSIISFVRNDFDTTWHSLVRRVGLERFIDTKSQLTGRVYDAATGLPTGDIPEAQGAFFVPGIDILRSQTIWSPDGRTFAVPHRDDHNLWYLWDIPPRKPLTWFAAGAALFALPMAWLARRRVRRLRAVVA